MSNLTPFELDEQVTDDRNPGTHYTHSGSRLSLESWITLGFIACVGLFTALYLQRLWIGVAIFVFPVIALVLRHRIARIVAGRAESEQRASNQAHFLRGERLLEERFRSQVWPDRMQDQINLHSATLLEKRSSLSIRDDYGEWDKSAWFAERDSFLDRFVFTDDIHLAGLDRSHFSSEMELMLDALDSGTIAQGYTIGNQSDFAGFCQSQFRELGFAVRSIPDPGDDGEEMIAERGDLSITVHCKNVARPVGARSIEIALSRKRHNSTTEAVCVSASGFSPEAQEVALSVNVHAVHAEDLRSWLDCYQLPPARAFESMTTLEQLSEGPLTGPQGTAH